jgi:hypothetical protein
MTNEGAYWMHGGLAGLIVAVAVWLKKHFNRRIDEIMVKFNGHTITYENEEKEPRG